MSSRRRLAGATLHALAIPFHERFGHSAAERAACDSVLVRLVDDEGREGWGEGAPRPYVTGESPATMLADLERAWPALAAAPLPRLEDPADLARLAAEPMAGLDGAARAAFELALVDCVLRDGGRAAAGLLPPRRATVRYGGVIGAGTVERVRALAGLYRGAGFARAKVKVGLPRDLDRVCAVREALGPEAAICADANGAWRPDAALRAVRELARAGVDWVEQPLPRACDAELPALRARSPLPLMADESLVTLADAAALAAAGAVDHFNLRVSKCGGLSRCLAVAAVAGAAGIGVQVGCQVGETAILSAAGRHLAAALPSVLAVEGSFGEALLVEDVGREPVTFGRGGLATPPAGPQLGVEVDVDRVARWTRWTLELGSRG